MATFEDYYAHIDSIREEVNRVNNAKPMKVIKTATEHMVICPVCDNYHYHVNPKGVTISYCPYCGHALNWVV